MNHFNFSKNQSAKKIQSLFNAIDESNLKEISKTTIENYIAVFFGASHLTIRNYFQLFLKFKFLELSGLETYTINYSKVQKYLKRVFDIETASYY